MSFFINNNNQNKPGQLCGNSNRGLCEKALIEVPKIFDACIIKSTDQGIILNAEGYNPLNPTFPLTYISSESSPLMPATVTDIVIDRLASAPNFANVSCNVHIPLVVTYRDADGVLGTASSEVVLLENVILFVPQAALSPVEIRATATFASSIGTYSEENVFTVTCCSQVILKVISVVDLLVPSYGYPVLPPNQSNPSPQCPGLFDLPLYPTAETFRRN